MTCTMIKTERNSVPSGEQRVGGSGVWEDTGPADHDGASKALPELLPAAVVHLQSSGPLSSSGELHFAPYSSPLIPRTSLLDNLV